jgi:hypothetical protein
MPAAFQDTLPKTSGQQQQQRKAKQKRTIIRDSSETSTAKQVEGSGGGLQAAMNDASMTKE